MKLFERSCQNFPLPQIIASLPEHSTAPIQLRSHRDQPVTDTFGTKTASRARKSDGW